MSGGNQVGQIGGQASSDALNLGNLSLAAMANRYKQLGLGAVPAEPVGNYQPAGGVGQPGISGVAGGTEGHAERNVVGKPPNVIFDGPPARRRDRRLITASWRGFDALWG